MIVVDCLTFIFHDREVAVYYKDQQFPKQSFYEGIREKTLRQADSVVDEARGKLDMSAGESGLF